MSAVNKHWAICRYAVAARFIADRILGGVSLFTLTAISVDRLLALLLGLRYRQVVTLKRTYVIVIIFWVVYIIFSTMYFWNSQITLRYASIVISLCLITSIFSYTKIFFQPPLSSKSSARPATTKPNNINSTEFSAIQEGSVQYTVVATDVSRLLPTAGA